LIESILSDEEYERYEQFETIDKIVVGLGKFPDTYQLFPSEKELSRFVGLTEQTVSKYVNRTTLIASKPQQKGPDGRFDEKRFHLTDEGKSRYGELTYLLIGYTSDGNSR